MTLELCENISKIIYQSIIRLKISMATYNEENLKFSFVRRTALSIHSISQPQEMIIQIIDIRSNKIMKYDENEIDVQS